MFNTIFYIIESSQHSGGVRPKMEAIVGATFASPKLPSDTVSTIQNRYHQITKRINIDYWNSTSETVIL